MEVHVARNLSSAAIEMEHSLTFSLLSQLAGIMEEHGTSDLGTVIQSVGQAALIPELFTGYRLLKWALFITLGAAAVLVLVYMAWRLRSLFYRFGRKLKRRVT